MMQDASVVNPPTYEYATDVDNILGPPPKYEPPIIHGLKYGRGGYQDNIPPRLAYADFLPKLVHSGTGLRPPTFDSFRDMLHYVNQWLASSPEYSVVRCESIDRKMDKHGDLETESTVYRESAFGTNTYLRGLRLWLLPNPHPEAGGQQIDYVNVMPRDFAKGGKLTYTGITMTGMRVRQASFTPIAEKLDTLLKKFNQELAHSPLPGQVLTVETLDLKYSERWCNRTGHVDPDQNFWWELGHTCKWYLSFLRIFYVKSPNLATHSIGLKDFVPHMQHTDTTGMTRPKFESYKDVFSRASEWIQEHHGRTVHFLNIQTVPIKLEKMFGKFEIDSREMIYDTGNAMDTSQVKVLRVAYIELAHADQLEKIEYCVPILSLSSKIIVPVRLARTQCETLRQTVFRTNAWLNLTGARIVGVDTLNYEFHPDTKTVRTEQVCSTKHYGTGHHWTTAIRLYIDGPFEEPPVELLPPVPDYQPHGRTNQRQRSSSCDIV